MEELQQKIDELNGTCDYVDLDEWSSEDLQVLDEQIFQCDTCGWWCEVGEESEEPSICNDCNE